ncbi:vWA domain-containing protein [Alicyclobacillus tolerans]|uniref:vWA domain-containing protein n=1 Tax=Alicyclobacillus tolerans TaxID=90970 RepID=UPI0027D90346|nr:VWA domain-containing protein [Alicyclobacillus tengchongensis]
MDVLSLEAKMKQILVITDGCSNVGESPIEAAADARRQGIAVNVIGVVEKGEMGGAGRDEVMRIAEAGNGMCRIVQPSDLSATAQMMTHQTMQLTLQQAVNAELKSVLGKTQEELPPEERARVTSVVDKLQEELHLDLIVLIDTSASMKHKMDMVREAVRDLSFSLSARMGSSRVAVAVFPGQRGNWVETVQTFSATLDPKALERCYVASGGTPTGPAIRHALQLFQEKMESGIDEQWAALD